MAGSFSFGQISSDRPAAAVAAETPFRLLVLGDWSGRATRGELGGKAEIGARRPRPVDLGGLDELLAQCDPQAQITLPGGHTLTLKFDELDSFHPDALVKQAEIFDEVDNLVGRLGNAQHAPAAVARLQAAEALDGAQQAGLPTRGTTIPAAASLSQLAELPSAADAGDTSADELALRLAAGEFARAGDGDAAAAAERTKAVAMRAVLHQPDYQGLEARWRGLHWLLRRLPKQPTLKVYLLDLTAEEFAADLAASDDLAASGLFQCLSEDARDQPLGLLVGLYDFEFSPPHIELLGRTAKIAAALNAPFVASLPASLANAESKPPADGAEAWEALRALPDADYLAVAAPRFLLRPPFGENYRQPEAIEFEEYTAAPFNYLWGNAALATAAVTAREFGRTGWNFAPSAAVMQLDENPLHVPPDSDGDAAVTTELALSGSASQRLADLGLIPVQTVRGRDAIALAAVRSASAEEPALAGLWQAASGIERKATARSKSGVSMYGGAVLSKTSKTNGDTADDDDSPAADSADSAGGDESVESAPEVEIDDELAALLGNMDAEPSGNGDESAAAGDEASQNAEEELDAELAALLADSSTEAPAMDSSDTGDLDDDLAALLADTASEAAPATLPEPTGDLDDDLAALLADTSAPEAADPDATTEPEASNEEPAAEEPVAENVDDDLAALLAGLDDDLASAPEAAAEPEPELAPPPPPPPVAAAPVRPQPAPQPMSTSDSDSSAADIPAQVAQVQAASKYGTAGSPPVLDFISLLDPIPGDEPQGEGVPFAVRTDLEQKRKEVNPDLFAADDPMRPEDHVRADWQGIIDLSQATLRDHAKNLLIAARLVEALTKQHGFAGLRDGLHLMRLLVEICWDRIEPTLEDEDLEVRAGPFNWIDDPDRGACFPFSVRRVPIVHFGGHAIGHLDFQQAQSSRNDEKLSAFERGAAQMSREAAQRIVDDVGQSLTELKFLAQTLSRKMRDEAPGLGALRTAIEESSALAQQILAKKGPAPSAGGTGLTTTAAGGLIEQGGGTVVVVNQPSMSSRDEIYRHLSDAATALERLEPHSPVPFLVRRAVHFGSLPYPELMRELVRDTNVLSEMNRELGIRGNDIIDQPSE